MKNKKFNYGRTSSYFPIKQHRYDTQLHPVHLSEEKCSAKIQLVLSHQEQQMVEGLSNILRTNEREAIRIACYEAATSLSKGVGNHLPYGSTNSKKRGHTGRNTKLALKLPSEEKRLILEASNELGCTEKELVRTAVIWLAKTIRNQDYDEITDSDRIAQDSLAKAWGKDNRETKGKLQALKQAHAVAYERERHLGELRNEEQYLARKTKLMEMGGAVRAYQSVDPDMTDNNWDVIDTLIEIDEQERVEQETAGMKREELIEYWTIQYMAMDPAGSDEDAEALAVGWVDELLSEKDS